MQIRIHRAAAEVGGNCIEVQAQGKSILLDLGLPLAAAKADVSLLPRVSGIDGEGDGSLLGVVLSHPHQDHYGLLACANPNVPVYLGDGARRLLEAASFFTETARVRQPITTYCAFKPLTIGPFTITPWPVDHSAYDAYALLIEADGKRLFYSGDFRMHGRKAHLMESELRHPPQGVDVLLMEGTTIGREDADAPMSESKLESEIVSSLKGSTGLALAYFSAQNIDRLVTFFRAALRSNRTFVIDVYTAHILDSLVQDSLPTAQSSSIRVFLPRRQKRQIVRASRFDLVEPYRRRRVYASQIEANPSRWLCLFRSSMAADFEAMNCLAGSTLMYSLWPGYLRREKDDVRRWAAANKVAFEIHHTSGHAYVRDLVRFVEAIAPKRLIPMHTARPHEYSKLFAHVEILRQGEWLSV